MTLQAQSIADKKRLFDWQRQPLRQTLIECAAVFLVAYLVMLLAMSRRPNPYDEGLVLTAAMRVAAGQIPHRDFYANYGPAQFYLLAGLFRLFGESLLVERLFDSFIKALLVAALYAVALSYCRKPIAAVTSAVALLWLCYLNNLSGTPVIPVSLLNLAGLTLILPVFLRGVSPRRMLAAGAVAGAAALFRYDTGVALFGIQACVVAIAIYLKKTPKALQSFASCFWPCLLGFVVVTLPCALYYLSVAPLHPLVYDIVLYPSHYYHHGRNLPFPSISPRALENLEVYLPLAAIGLSLYVAVAGRLRARGAHTAGSQTSAEEQRVFGFLVTFALLALAMYLKGLVRITVDQMFLTIAPTLLLIAVLFQHRLPLSRLLRASILGLVGLSVLAVTWATIHKVKELYLTRLSMPQAMVMPAEKMSPELQEWCKTRNPLTRGICFLPDADRIRVIEFIDSHTAPDQRLYLGLSKHDRVFANDNLTYFATQRLPATMWSHFDPGLQNSYGTQAEMVHELDVNAPPYVVLDTEFDTMHEPNDSSVSSGITLLDDYIRHDYRLIQTFGRMSIWQRIK